MQAGTVASDCFSVNQQLDRFAKLSGGDISEFFVVFHVVVLHQFFFECLPQRRILHHRRGTVLVGHVIVPDYMANRHAVFLHQFPYQFGGKVDAALPHLAACIQHTDLHTDAVCVPARRMVVCTLCAAMPRRVVLRDGLPYFTLIYKEMCGCLSGPLPCEIVSVVFGSVASVARVMHNDVINIRQPAGLRCKIFLAGDFGFNLHK